MIKFNELAESYHEENHTKNVLDWFSPTQNETRKKNAMNSKNNKNVPWIEKYRPTKLSEVVHQEDIIKMLKTVLKTGNLPHLLLYGPSGVGKTSIILAAAMEIFGPKKFSERVIELNASDERGINIVRNKIVTLAKTAVSSPDPNYICPPFKLIILDEADAMTNEAQSALRKIMEDKSNITRFCFICNYINQIIEPIISRCVKFRFKHIGDQSMTTKLNQIIVAEKMNINKDAIMSVINVATGDLRKAIMILQNLNYLEKEITVDDVHHIANLPPLSILQNIIDVCLENGSVINKIMELTNNFKKAAYPLNNIITHVLEMIIQNKKMTDLMKAKISYHLLLINKRLVDGADEYLQLLNTFMYINSVFNNKDNPNSDKFEF